MISSRERLLRCIRHQPIDRVPINTYELVGWNENAWENKEASYMRLMDAIRKYTDCMYLQNPEIISGGLSRIEEVIWAEGASTYTKTIHHTPKGDLDVITRVDERYNTSWRVTHLFKEPGDIDKYLSMSFEPEEYDLDAYLKEKDQLGDNGLMMMGISDPIGCIYKFFTMEQYLIYMITEREKMKYFCDAIFERVMQNLKNMMKYGMKDVIVRIAGLEMLVPPLLPPEYIDEFAIPYLVKICETIKSAGAITRIHCHGRIRAVLDRLMNIECDGLDPLEGPPDGDMELSEIKAKYGDKICLFGNIQARELEVVDKGRIDLLVRKAIEAGKPGGGFVLMPTGAPYMVPLTPTAEENYLQMIETVMQHGKY